MAKTLDIHKHNMRWKLNLQVLHYITALQCNAVHFKKCRINMAISLYNMVLD